MRVASSFLLPCGGRARVDFAPLREGVGLSEHACSGLSFEGAVWAGREPKGAVPM